MSSGIERIAAAFAAKGSGSALMPYMMGGFPDRERSLAVGHAYVDAGADLIELGIPFSDPLADGPVIQAASTRALEAGTTPADVLEICRDLAPRVPVVVMVYANVVLADGYERFAQRLVDAGACGLIIPDLPLEESDDALAACEAAGIALVPLVAPTSSSERMAKIGARARGFVYAVSLVGTTGERSSLAAAYADTIRQAKAHTEAPVALGFGISDPDQAREAAASGADGVIVGSRLVRAVAEATDAGQDPAAAAGEVVKSFRAALG